MRQLVESLKRLYLAQKVTIARIQLMLADEKITQVEYDYITLKEDE